MSLVINDEVNNINNKQKTEFSRSRQQLHQEMIIKTEAVEDDKFDYYSLLASSKLKYQDEPNHSSCDGSSESDNFENIFCPVKKESEDLGADEVRQVQGTENLTLTELKQGEIDIEDHKPEWGLIKGSSSHVGMFKDELDRCESVQESESRSSERTREEQANYNCAQCSYKTNNNYYFTRHYYFNHSKDAKVYKCQGCSYNTKYKGNFTQHFKLKHSEDAEVYKCRECSYQTKQKRHFTQHYKYKHLKDSEVYKCQECTYKTKIKGNLIKHCKFKHEEVMEVYQCEECSYQTIHKYSLANHYKIKHSKQAEVYKCKECFYETSYKCNLTRHYKLKHEQVVEVYKGAD